MVRRLDFHSADFVANFEMLLSGKREQDSDVHDAVAKIIADVRANGDAAVLALTAQFDNLQAETMAELAVGQDEMALALDGLTTVLRDALELAADRIRMFHKKSSCRAGFHL